MKKPIIILLLIIVFSCSKRSEEEGFLLKTIQSSNSVALATNTVEIPIDSISLTYYSKVSSFKYNDEEFLAGYNERIHSIDLFNLSKKQLYQHVRLEKEGPNAVGRVYNIEVHSIDSIFIFDSSKTFKLIDRNAKVKYQTPSELYFHDVETAPYGSLQNINEAQFYYHQQRQSIICHYKPHLVDASEPSSHLSKSIMIEISVKDGSANTLPIFYSDYAEKHNDAFVSDLIPNISFSEDMIIYNFPFGSNVYVYDLNTKQHMSFGGASQNSINLVAPYELKKYPIERYIITESRFLTTHYDYVRDVFIRLHWGNQPLKQMDGKYNTLITKPGFITVFNKKGELLTEIALNRKEVFPDDAFINSNGLHLWYDPTYLMSGDTLKLKQYIFEY